jgi:hypothetical protein
MHPQQQLQSLNLAHLQASQMHPGQPLQSLNLSSHMMPHLMQSNSGGQQGQQGGYPGLQTGLPVATMVNINGVPQLVALMPQQYHMAAGQGMMQSQQQQNGLQGGLLSPQQQMQQLHALAQQQPFPYHNGSLPVVPSGWGDTAGAPIPGGGMGGFAPSAAQAGGGGGAGWQTGGGGGGSGGGGKAGGGKQETGGNAEPRHSKRASSRGRETRTIDEASEAGVLRELAHEQHGCRFLQDQLDLRHKPHVDLIFEATKADALTLAMDPFGNYLVRGRNK